MSANEYLIDASTRHQVLRHTSKLDTGEMKLFMDWVYAWALDNDLPDETTVGMNIIRFNHGGEIIFSHHNDYKLYSKNCGLGQYNVVWDRQND